MNKISDSIAKEIDSRCPCYAKSISECDCQPQEPPTHPKKLLRKAVVVELPETPITAPNKPPSFT